jgi:hypothetical protein
VTAPAHVCLQLIDRVAEVRVRLEIDAEVVDCSASLFEAETVSGAGGDGAVEVGVDRVVAVGGRPADPVVRFVRGVVLGEAAGGVVPLDGGRAGGSRAEGTGDVVGLFEAGDTGPDAQVVAELLVDLVDFGFDVVALSEQGGGVLLGEPQIGEGGTPGVEVVLGVGDQRGGSP